MVLSGSLQIRHSLESDEGSYECFAENTVGLAVSVAANLYIRGQSLCLLTAEAEVVRGI